MAAFDEKRDCVVVRVVYDGPAFAGKTTNLQRICELFPVERRTELYTPGALKGRTMFFDWLEVESGKAGAHRMRFQLLTVPGQKQRNYRRRPLVELADAIVLVCDCSPDRLEDTRYVWSRLSEYIKRREQPLPLVLQANKQDAPGALSPQQILEELRIDGPVPIVSAQASEGVGVKETLVTAMRAALVPLKATLEGGGIQALSTRVATAEGLFNAMLELEDRRLAQLEAAAAAEDAGSVAAVETDAPLEFAPLEEPAREAAETQQAAEQDASEAAPEAESQAYATPAPHHVPTTVDHSYRDASARAADEAQALDEADARVASLPAVAEHNGAATFVASPSPPPANVALSQAWLRRKRRAREAARAAQSKLRLSAARRRR